MKASKISAFSSAGRDDKLSGVARVVKSLRPPLVFDPCEEGGMSDLV
jgi:hypothetical protein